MPASYVVHAYFFLTILCSCYMANRFVVRSKSTGALWQVKETTSATVCSLPSTLADKGCGFPEFHTEGESDYFLE